jgi:hypothetical protein
VLETAQYPELTAFCRAWSARPSARDTLYHFDS